MEELVCPSCHSNQLSANQKGFSSTNAFLGNMAGGTAMGLGLGMMGSGRIVITCLKCGNQFKAGDGSIRTVTEDGSESIKKQIFIDKDKANGRKIAGCLMVLLVVIIVAAAIFYNSLSIPTYLTPASLVDSNNSSPINSVQNTFKYNNKRKKKRYFVGTKTFCNTSISQCYEVEINNIGEVTVKDISNTDNGVIIEGKFKDDEVIDSDGKVALMRLSKSHLYIKGIDYIEQQAE